MSKELKFLVIHCTATPEGREVTSAEIRARHTNPVSRGGRGWKQVGYTDMIHLDGRIERLVQNNEDGWVDSREITNGAQGHNTQARHVVYVGGVAADGKTPRDTRTEAQRAAMAEYIRAFRAKNPKVRIIGHNDLDRGKACPSFSVSEWLKTIER